MSRVCLELAVALLGLLPLRAGAGTLDDVRARGTVRCGVSGDLPGFSSADEAGGWKGLNIDFCRAAAAAIFADPARVEFVPLAADEAFEALRARRIDVLARNTPLTFAADAGAGINFAGVLFYDGQVFLVPRTLGISSALELSGATVCVQKETGSEPNVATFFRSKGLPHETIVLETTEEMLQAYEIGRCNVVSAASSRLNGLRLRLAKPDDHLVLPEVISKEPLGPAVRQGDDQWFDIVKWTLFALIEGEELHLTRANVDQMKQSSDPRIRRFLGSEEALGGQLGLDDGWAYQIVKQVGNYGEIFEADLGQDSPLKIARGINDLWNADGLHYAPPFR